jgi:hypothetical protein
MAKAQPKVGDLLEILLLEIEKLKSQIAQNGNSQYTLSKKINDISVKVDLTELESIQKQYSIKFQQQFHQFFREINKGNEDFIKINNSIKLKTIRYILILNFILLLGFGISLYIAINNRDYKSKYEQTLQERDSFRNKFYQAVDYFEANPKEKEEFLNWNKKKIK